MDARHDRRSAGVVLTALAVVVLAAMATTVVTTRQSEARAAAALAATTMDAASLPVTVPLRRSGGQLLIEVSFGDGGPAVPMLVDTGAPTMVSEQLAARLGATPSGSIDTIAPDGTSVIGRTVALPQVRIGGLTFDEVGAVVVPSESALALLGMAQGGIGANLMQFAVWQVDVPAGMLTVAENVADLGLDDDAIGLYFRSASSASPSPIVDLGVGMGHVPFLVDTGSNGGLAANPIDLAAVGIPVEAAGGSRRMSLASWSGWGEPVVASIVAQVAVGDSPPGRHPVLATHALARGMGIIGTDFLADYVLTIDWPSRRLYLDPSR